MLVIRKMQIIFTFKNIFKQDFTFFIGIGDDSFIGVGLSQFDLDTGDHGTVFIVVGILVHDVDFDTSCFGRNETDRT